MYVESGSKALGISERDMEKVVGFPDGTLNRLETGVELMAPRLIVLSTMPSTATSHFVVQVLLVVISAAILIP